MHNQFVIFVKATKVSQVLIAFKSISNLASYVVNLGKLISLFEGMLNYFN